MVLITGACKNTGVAIVEKFAGEGRGVVFTGRNFEAVHKKEKEYKEKFPNVKIIGYHIDSLPRCKPYYCSYRKYRWRKW